MSIRSAFALALGASVTILAACSDSTTSPKTNTLDLATLLAEASSSQFVAASAGNPELEVVFSNAPAFVPGNCAFTASTGFFVCPSMAAGGLTFTRMFKLLDAAGDAQSAPNAQTAALEARLTVTGTVTISPSSGASGRGDGPSTLVINRSEDMTLSGLQSSTHILNGNAVSSVDLSSVTTSGTFGTKIDQTEHTTNLLLPDLKAGQKWPQSGNIEIDQSTTFDQIGPLVTTTKVTFNGTSKVTVTTTIGSISTTCTIDLASTLGLQPLSCQ